MTVLKNILAELFGLFVDDGSLAVAVIALTVVGAIVLHGRVVAPSAVAALLFVGIGALLAENVVRAAKTHGRRSGRR